MRESQVGVGSESPLVSIIVPAYNAEPYFEECLCSIESQTYHNLEIIIVDDGSTDATLEIARSHAADDSRIIVMTQQNQYAGVARNNGMGKATGKYICFFDADDVFRPSMIECMVARAEATIADVVVCRSDHLDALTHEITPIWNSLAFVDVEKVYSGVDLKDYMFRFCVGWPWDKLYRKEYIDDLGLKFQSLRTTNDAFFVFMSLILARRIAFKGQSLVLHRTNNHNSLEYIRNKSSQNALLAADAIESKLRECGLYRVFERSFVNWIVNFSVWNVRTLSESVRTHFLFSAKETIVPLLPSNIDESFFYLERDWRIASLLKADYETVLSEAVLTELSLEDAKNDAARKQDELNSEIKRLEDEVNRLQSELHSERELRLSLESSRTFRVGRVIMAVPCRLKDALSKVRSD